MGDEIADGRAYGPWTPASTRTILRLIAADDNRRISNFITRSPLPQVDGLAHQLLDFRCPILWLSNGFFNVESMDFFQLIFCCLFSNN
ncbi:hypothetical protein PGT21_027565 [Puccinia graminis f. sp. tritici]|uniref:Uncharacterized protein n=1 Tax=Puccinia graminis f. sp. tritici TaxID=56615 RepID=A0A5B0MPV3_PUCGR|nr:hypothetical protein PGT21_027565 [Puccinia graminis f. sp. tritici]